MPLTTQQRRDLINKTKPWEKSTGAKSELGKLIISTNALKFGIYSKNTLIRHIARQERIDQLFGELETRIIEVLEAKRGKGVNNGKS